MKKTLSAERIRNSNIASSSGECRAWVKSAIWGLDNCLVYATYSLEYYQQANARLHRHGQKNKVMVHHLTVRDSIDDAVIDALNNKDHNRRPYWLH